MDELRHVITPERIDRARQLCLQQDLQMIGALQQITLWSADQLMVSLGISFHYDVLDMLALQELQPNFKSISYTECIQRGLLFASNGQENFLVLANPFDGDNESWALRRANAECHIVLTHPDNLQAYLVKQEHELRAMDGFNNESSQYSDEDVAAIITLSTISDDASPVVKLVNSTIYDALKLQASDIHLECDAGCLHILYRIDGVLVQVTQVQSQDMVEQVISRIKVMAELDIAERRIPQDGRFKVRINGREIDFRVSIMPNIFGEDAVLRLLDRQSLTEEAKSLRLENLGLDIQTRLLIRKMAKKPYGMVLVTGPTGSGKTTTLYAAITEIHTGSDKIVTIEDPVEYRLPRVLQIPVNEKKGLTFARGLRSILRHDPDKIMVGEIRDDETAQIAVQAALTGHLVFTTVHANNVFDVLGRFLHMGVDAYSFAAALNGIVAQRLLRINCPHCLTEYVPDDDELDLAGLSRDQVLNWTFKAGQGCGQCRGVGFKGRKAVAEVLQIDDTLREMIASQAPITMLKEHAMRNGLKPLHQTALQLVSDGVTTLQEVTRVAG